jgi:RNA polymerase sigma factor (sigma-70 family)
LLFPCNKSKLTCTLIQTAFKLKHLNQAPTIEQLVQQCINGDSRAYKMVYDNYSKAMYNIALRIVGKVADAEDVLQDAFIDAFGQLKSFRGTSTFGAWLKQIVVYKSLNYIKKQKLVFAEFDDAQSANISESDSVNEQAFSYNVELIKNKINELPTGYRAVLSLHLIDGYGQEEIATMLEVTHSTIRTQYLRAKQKLFQLIKNNIDYA